MEKKNRMAFALARECIERKRVSETNAKSLISGSRDTKKTNTSRCMLKGIHAALNRYASSLSLAQKNQIQRLIQSLKKSAFQFTNIETVRVF